VQDNVMAFTYQDTGGGAAKPVGGAGDEDTAMGSFVRLACWCLTN
jgi:hypothetical protein